MWKIGHFWWNLPNSQQFSPTNISTYIHSQLPRKKENGTATKLSNVTVILVWYTVAFSTHANIEWVDSPWTNFATMRTKLVVSGSHVVEGVCVCVCVWERQRERKRERERMWKFLSLQSKNVMLTKCVSCQELPKIIPYAAAPNQPSNTSIYSRWNLMWPNSIKCSHWKV